MAHNQTFQLGPCDFFWGKTFMSSKQFQSIRNLVRADGYEAVWVHHGDDRINVERWPLDFVGVADVMECQDGEWIGVDTQIVGIELVGGTFRVLPNIPSY